MSDENPEVVNSFLNIKMRLPTTIETMMNNIGQMASQHQLTHTHIYMHVDQSTLDEYDGDVNNWQDTSLHVLQNNNRNCWHTTFYATFSNNDDMIFVILFNNLPHFDHDHKSTESQHIATQFTTFSDELYPITCQHIQTFHDMYEKQFYKSSQFTKDKKISLMTNYVQDTFGSNFHQIVLFIIDDDLHKHTHSRSYVINKLNKIFNIQETKTFPSPPNIYDTESDSDDNDDEKEEEQKETKTIYNSNNIVNVHFLDMYTATISLYGNDLQACQVSMANDQDVKTKYEYPTVDVYDPSIVQAFPTIPTHELIRQYILYKYYDQKRGVWTKQIRQIVMAHKSDKKKVEAWKEIK